MAETGIGSRIRILREQKGWEILQLARAGRVSHSYIYKLEHNERPNVAGVVLARLADALDTTTDYLLGRTPDPAPVPAPVDALRVEHALRLRELAERVARLPDGRQGPVIDLALRVAALAADEE